MLFKESRFLCGKKEAARDAFKSIGLNACVFIPFTSVSYILYLQIEIIGVTLWDAARVNVLMLLRFFKPLNESIVTLNM